MPVPGTGVLAGRAYVFPDTTGGAKNFATAHGQDVPLTPRAYSGLDVLLAAHGGDVKSTATVHYSDGSTAQVALDATDWAAGSPRLGEDIAVHADSRYDSDGRAGRRGRQPVAHLGPAGQEQDSGVDHPAGQRQPGAVRDQRPQRLTGRHTPAGVPPAPLPRSGRDAGHHLEP